MPRKPASPVMQQLQTASTIRELAKSRISDGRQLPNSRKQYKSFIRWCSNCDANVTGNDENHRRAGHRLSITTVIIG